MVKSKSAAIAAGLALLALSVRSLLAMVASIAILAAMVLRPRRPSDRTALLTVAALVAVGLGCGPQEDSDPVATTLTNSKRALDRPLPSPGGANPAETAPTNAPRIRDRVSSATTRSAEPYIAEQTERLPELDSYDPEPRTAEQAELLSDLDSPDPEARADAVDWLDLEGDVLERMISLLESDPDADVRATIVDRLGEEASPTTLAALVVALRDPDPEVVLRAIEALEFEAEDWVIPDLEPLLSHFDPEVREAAQDAIGFLE